MKFQFIKEDDERVVVYAKERNEVVEQIESIVINTQSPINGYSEDDIVPLNINDIVSFYAENDKTYATLTGKTYLVKLRLYQIEDRTGSNFIKINKSRIINRNFIERFDLSWTGTLLVVMKNGDKDYVSRRLITTVKEKMNIK